ncbi:MAG: VWA domain-containing protein [Deltaproteobacteria bacterium]|nr:VWA domain-containing protein [Deltaproteobacteria bacterium]
MIRFAYPSLLTLLIAVFIWVLLALRRRPAALIHSHASAMARIGGGRSGRWARAPLWMRALALVLLALAVARPQLYNISREIPSSGVDIVLCLDTSGSMRALDFEVDGKQVDRLTAVKRVVGEFIRKREYDRLGLVVFGKDAYTQSPLTLDKGLLLTLIQDMQIGMAGDRTAIGSALAVGAKRLKQLKAKAKILILLTDGRSNFGTIGPEAAAEAARALGIKIYSIGVGGFGPAPFKVDTPFGERLVHQQVDLDEGTLQQVADIGGGHYFRASDSKSLAEIYDMIDREEKTEIKMKEFFHFEELYRYFLIPALILLLGELAVSSFFVRVLP